MSIKFIRIDDRLIHGQVVTAWIKNYQAKKILIIDDQVAADSFLINVLKMVAPSGIELRIEGTDNLTQLIAEYEADDKNTVLLMKTPQTAQKVFDSGAILRALNVGGMGASKTRKNLYKNVSASDDEVAVLKVMEDAGIRVYFQATPNDKQIDLKNLK
ncbi:PTS system mannose/fructose/N-acetylgalactosamine-transporter subunit IIB [Dielma fastidiosa]|uniref:PTS sugar transporter subunit IIB n=1 Tax=Dielma fastidiosa TaxID=1034346 RepID=A0AB35ULZ9_9FIRM|nr:PTS sugar transporter subunit IIB [Dielma fastidiosa]MDY5167971.1 PTS sugar transporter subunit IIB [Dielma fastidiosa]